uniref:Uncharacterized protein n=1 Tax=Rangifer tarandus platyrhynchus TaxID=3082113 RepID=A0ACB0F7Q6_RANTA|nr:unnamed protein product [Rangifer tarandus platyrhynchus]
MEGTNPPLLKGAGLSGTRSDPPHTTEGCRRAPGVGGSGTETVRKKARARWRACRPGDADLDRVPPVARTLISGWPSPRPRSLGKRPPALRPPPQALVRDPLLQGAHRARPPPASALEPISAGGASPPSRSLPPAHTKTTRADRGAWGRAPRSSGAHTTLSPSGTDRVQSDGLGGRGNWEDKQAVPIGAQLRPSGPGRRRSAARTAAGLPGPGGSWPSAGSGSLRAAAGVGGGSSLRRPQPRRLVRSSLARRSPGSALLAAELRALRAQPRAARAPPRSRSYPPPVRRAPSRPHPRRELRPLPPHRPRPRRAPRPPRSLFGARSCCSLPPVAAAGRPSLGAQRG